MSRQGQQGSQQDQQKKPRQTAMNAAEAQQLEQTLKRLQQATEDMRRANSSPDQAGAGGRRAAERLAEAQQSLQGMRRQQSSDQMSNLSDRANEVARRQAEFEKQMRQTYGRGGSRGAQPGAEGQPTREQNEKLAEQKEKIFQDLDKLEKDMQQTVRATQGTQPGASSKLREALGDLQQSETKSRMKMISQAIKRGQGAYAIGSEAMATATLDKMKDQVAEAQKALDGSKKGGAQSASGEGDGKGAGQGKDGGKDLEAALEKVERLRAQLQQLSQSKGAGGQQPGKGSGQQPGGQQPGQQPGGQQGSGQQPGGQQPGGQPGGQQPGGRQPGGQMSRGEGGSPNSGGQTGGPGGGGGQVQPGDAERTIREGVRDIGELRQMLKDNPELARELGDAYRSMQRLGGGTGAMGSDAELEDRLKRNVLPNIESIETQLRRQLEESRGGQVRSTATERAPDGYADKVAEYFRRLSKGK